MSRKLTQEEFISKAKKVHKNTYNYELVKYEQNKKKVEIICVLHGSFRMIPNSHLMGQGCPKCRYEKSSKKLRFSTKKFIEQAKKVHGNKYDYSLVDYKNSTTNIKIKCLIHNYIFEQKPANHIHHKQGCPKCGGNAKLSTEQFIEKAKKIHGNKYDYSSTMYDGGNRLVTILCKSCNKTFTQKAEQHLQGSGCKICTYKILSEKFSYTLETFISKAITRHGDKYDYSKVIYKNCFTKVILTCKKHNKEFLIKPMAHINSGNGCPICKSSKGEIIISNILDSLSINYIPQKRFKECKNIKELPFDFYLPKENNGKGLCIEYQGVQHFKPISIFGGISSLLKTQNNDRLKREYCRNNNILLIEYTYKDNFETIKNDLEFQFKDMAVA
jgi:hypothetical protein